MFKIPQHKQPDIPLTLADAISRDEMRYRMYQNYMRYLEDKKRYQEQEAQNQQK